MSLPHQHLTLPTDVIRITPWTDPVLDQLGHDARSTYVERFWLPILGPTTTLFLRRVAHELDDRPEGFDLPVLDTASALGLGVQPPMTSLGNMVGYGRSYISSAPWIMLWPSGWGM